MKSPLRYPGGKSKCAAEIASRFPSGIGEYREPFAGGASLFLMAAEMGGIRRFWINDLYYDVYCFWKCVCSGDNDMVSMVESLYGRKSDGYEKFVESLKSMEPKTESETAARFFAINRTTFSGISNSGGYSKESFDRRFTATSVSRLKDVMGVGGGSVKVTNLDYSELLSCKGDDVFVFLDPPYYSATDSGLYGDSGDMHKGFDHVRLRDTLNSCGHRWLMTYDDCDYIRNLYSGYNIMPFELYYGMRNVTAGGDLKGKEILISNYSIDRNVALF